MRFRILRPVNQTPAPQVLELSQLNLSRSSVLQYLDSIQSAAVIGCQRCYLLSALYPEDQNKPHNVTETIHKSSLFGAVSCEILSIPGLCAPTRGATLRRTFSPSGPPARQPRDSGGPVNLAVRPSLSRPSYLLGMKVFLPWVLSFPGGSCYRRAGFRREKGVPQPPLNGKPG